MRSSIVLFLIVTIAAGAVAAGDLTPDSFGYLQGPSLVPGGSIAVETHINWTSNRYGSVVGFPNAMLRFGLPRRAEFQLLLPSAYRFTGRGVQSETRMANGSLGFKGRLTDQRGVLPSTGLTLTAGMPIFENEIASQNMWAELDVQLNWLVAERVRLTPMVGLYLHDPAGMLETYGVLVELELHERLWLAGDYGGIIDEDDASEDWASGRLCIQVDDQLMVAFGVRKVLRDRVEEQYVLGAVYSPRRAGDEAAPGMPDRPRAPRSRRRGI